MIIDPVQSERLFCVLDGLPLAIAQAGAYLQETGVGLETYLKFYQQQWEKLMKSQDLTEALLQNYPDRSVWTTWAISYNAVKQKDEITANLLLLWAFLDNRNLWHGLLAAACERSTLTKSMLSVWIGDVANDELEFAKAMRLLRNYSLIEDVEDRASYATHPVIHRWAYYFQGKDARVGLAELAVLIVGWAVPHRSTRDYSLLQRRLFPHAQACSQWVSEGKIGGRNQSCEVEETDSNNIEKKRSVLDAIHLLGLLYADQGKLAEAETMYERALRGKEEALGPTHTSTLNTVNNLGNLYAHQGKLAKAEMMYERALRGYENALGLENASNYRPALNTMTNLGQLYTMHGELAKAQEKYLKALLGFENICGTSSKEYQSIKAMIKSLDLSPGKT